LSSDRVQILGVPVDAVDEAEVLDFVRHRVELRQPARIATVNVEYVVQAQTDPTFARVLGDADLATPDSAGIVWAVRHMGRPVERRVGGADLIWSMCRQAAECGHRVFLLGARQGVASRAAAALQRRYPDLVVAGTFAGSPSPREEAHIVDLIRRARADVLLVAFGAPQQDLWIARNLQRTGVYVAMGVGGSFDYVAGTARRAPLWMRERGIEWLWRLVQQPRRWRRMLALPRFLWLIWRAEAATTRK
jgi:N-acetylglucosaminyldiphosphoundecaprenol N-acetyl-beta-D-mannosaminyltransferase